MFSGLILADCHKELKQLLCTIVKENFSQWKSALASSNCKFSIAIISKYKSQIEPLKIKEGQGKIGNLHNDIIFYSSILFACKFSDCLVCIAATMPKLIDVQCRVKNPTENQSLDVLPATQTNCVLQLTVSFKKNHLFTPFVTNPL